MLDKILSYFSDEEIQQYGSRISTGKDLSKTTIHIQVALLDDWSLSGKQLQNARTRIESNASTPGSSLEIHQAIATNERTGVGLERTHPTTTDVFTPVIAYFEAHQSRLTGTKAGCHITSYHSSANFDFEYALQVIVDDAIAVNSAEATSILCRP